MKRIAVVVMALSLLSLPAQAHTEEEIETWLQEWEVDIPRGGLTVDHALLYADFANRHTWYFHPEPVVTTRTHITRPIKSYAGVEGWRSLVAAYWPADEVDRALCIMHHESRGDPTATNPSSGAAGLFQVMPFWWDHYGGDRYDPETNVRVAKQVWDQQYWWGWSPYKRGLCR